MGHSKKEQGIPRLDKHGRLQTWWCHLCTDFHLSGWDLAQLDPQRERDLTDSLHERGFVKWNAHGSPDPKEIRGKTLLIKQDTFFFDFLAMPIEDIIQESMGWTIVTPKGNPHIQYFKRWGAFMDILDRRTELTDQYYTKGWTQGPFKENWLSISRQVSQGERSVELFLPWFSRTWNILMGPHENLPVSELADPSKFGWGYQKKVYLSEEQLERDYFETAEWIREHISKRRNPNWLNSRNLDAKRLSKRLGIPIEVSYREKTVPSYFASAMRGIPGRTWDNVRDINGFRFIVPTPNDCYRLACEIYANSQRPDYVRDWIAVPKANGFQVLTIAYRQPSVEIQIQTPMMAKMASEGQAADYHENYIKPVEGISQV